MSNPAESHEERIFDNVALVLGQIRRSDGYWYDVAPDSATRKERAIDQIVACVMPYYQVIDGDSRWQESDTLMPRAPMHIVEVLIDGLIKETDPEKRPTAVNRAIRDVMRKLQEDTGRGLDPTTGTKTALYTRVASIERFDAALGYEQYGAFRITLEVMYRYTWDNP